MVHRQIQDFGNVQVLETHLQGLAVKARPVAHIAGYIHIRQELHFNTQLPLPLAGLAATTVYIEGETPWFVPAHLALRHFGEQGADMVKQTSVSRWVGARRAPDGRLVDVDDLVQVLQPFDAVVGSGLGAGAVQLVRQFLVQDIHHQS